MLKREVVKLFLEDSDIRQDMFDSAVLLAAESPEIKDWIEEFAVQSFTVYYDSTGPRYAHLYFCRTRSGNGVGEIQGLSVCYNFSTDSSTSAHNGHQRSKLYELFGKLKSVTICRGIRGNFYEQK